MINGTYRLIYINWEGELLPIGCSMSDNFEENVDMLETTTRDNNGWKTSVPTNQSYNFSFEGLIMNTNFEGGSSNKISYDRLIVLKRNRTLIEWVRKDSLGEFKDYGKGYISKLSDSANVDEFISFSCSVVGYGEPISEKGEIPFGLQSLLQSSL